MVRSPRRTFATPFVVTLAACGPAQHTSNPPGPVQPAPTEGAPAPQSEQRWFVSKAGDSCLARPRVDCPKPEPGKPTHTCNPPPPIKYECPKNGPNEDFTIVQWAGAAECFVDPGPMDCPAGASCNPPPPIIVPCPKR